MNERSVYYSRTLQQIVKLSVRMGVSLEFF